MASVLVTVGEAVKAAIEDHNFGVPFEIERNYADFDVELQDIMPLRLDVFAFRHASAELGTRNSISYETEVDVCIRRKFGMPDADPDQRISLEAIDLLVQFTESVHEFLARLTLGDDSNWSDAKLLWCPNKKHIRGRQFTGLIRLTHTTDKVLT